MRIAPILLLCFSLVSIGLGAWAAVREADPYLHASLDGAGQTEALIGGSLDPALSAQASQAYAETCLEAAPRLGARMLTGVRGEAFDAACSGRIGDLALRSPVNAFLWYAQARLAALDGDSATLSAALVSSVASGPNEYWLAARRFDLAERYSSGLTPPAIEAHDHDILMLAGTGQGSRLLAARFVLAPEFQERATRLLETLPEGAQANFLFNVAQFSEQRSMAP